MSRQGKRSGDTATGQGAANDPTLNRRSILLGGTTLAAAATAVGASARYAVTKAQAQQPASGGKPNILVIFGDDIGVPQISAYTMGMMGYRTPNIDRIANEGAIFTDAYGQQSCTAGRASFILGQEPFRTGLLTIGMPGDPHGIQDWMPTIADVLKTQGYATGQFGKNHLGDRDEHLPTKHGFDEFFGNLYHLNAEEEPEGYFYPKDPEFRKKYGPRGVIKSSADGKIEDTGPLNVARMPTVDEEFLGAAKDFIGRQTRANRPFFVWFNTTRMHVFTHLKKESLGKTGKGIHADGMVEHDGMAEASCRACARPLCRRRSGCPWAGGSERSRTRLDRSSRWPSSPSGSANKIGAEAEAQHQAPRHGTET
jgi:arylsulfatase